MLSILFEAVPSGELARRGQECVGIRGSKSEIYFELLRFTAFIQARNMRASRFFWLAQLANSSLAAAAAYERLLAGYSTQ